jgi:GH25 family lysozyme M1 (1,4-beta-N-acetylmuramidase)
LHLRRPAALAAALAITWSALAASPALAAQPVWHPAGVLGIDVSSWQPHVDWKTVKADHLRFAFIKATQGTYYQSPTFKSQRNGAHRVGVVTGAYVFATPNTSSGASQARYFAAHGGGWKADSLPGVLDIESNPYGKKCYGLKPAAIVSWIRSFVREYHARTGWWPIINTYTPWWNSCTGGSAAFAGRDKLWINADRGRSPKLPSGWTSYAVWQWRETGVYPADQDVIPAHLFSRLHHEPR